VHDVDLKNQTALPLLGLNKVKEFKYVTVAGLTEFLPID
jgi:hypothetical protein